MLRYYSNWRLRNQYATDKGADSGGVHR